MYRETYRAYWMIGSDLYHQKKNSYVTGYQRYEFRVSYYNILYT